MMEEYQNDVWDIVPKPKRKSVVSSNWIYKIKHVADGRKYLWLKDSLRKGIDYEETFSPRVTDTSIRNLSILSYHVELRDILQSLPLKWSIIISLHFVLYVLKHVVLK